MLQKFTRSKNSPRADNPMHEIQNSIKQPRGYVMTFKEASSDILECKDSF